MRPAIALLQIPLVRTVILIPLCLNSLAAPRAVAAEGSVVPTRVALVCLLVVAKLVDFVIDGAGAGAPRDELVPTEDTLPLRVLRRLHFGQQRNRICCVSPVARPQASSMEDS